MNRKKKKIRLIADMLFLVTSQYPYVLSLPNLIQTSFVKDRGTGKIQKDDHWHFKFVHYTNFDFKGGSPVN